MLNREEELRFCKARRAAIALDYQNLNPEQRRAALATDGPLLLLAGAGSGKTTVLIHRIANLMKYGRGSDCDEAPAWAAPADLAFLEGYVQNPDPAQKAEQERLCRVDPAVPWSIIAITFTNKAAGELKERLERMLCFLVLAASAAASSAIRCSSCITSFPCSVISEAISSVSPNSSTSSRYSTWACFCKASTNRG